MADLICPECHAVLTVQGGHARCMAHGANYEVLFDRDAEALRRTSSQVAAPAGVCTNHPRTAAVYTCPKCARPICTMCAYEVRGRAYCPDCATHAASGAEGEPELTVPEAYAPAAAVNDSGFLTLNLTAPAPPSLPAGLMCVQHAEIDASMRCRVCSSGMCAVCDFALPNGMHVCPACIETRGTDGVSSHRTGVAWGGIAFAIFTTLFFIVAMAGQVTGNLNQTAATFINMVVLALSVAGVAISFSAYEPSLGNSPLIWTGAIWNTILLSLLVLFSIVGAFFI